MPGVFLIFKLNFFPFSIDGFFYFVFFSFGRLIPFHLHLHLLQNERMPMCAPRVHV